MLTFGSVLCFFGVYNVYNYLYKQEKYKMWVNTLLYIASILCVTLNMAYSLLVPISDYCNPNWFLTSYAAAYCDLIVGICQAYLLSMLKNQLKCLFQF